MKSDRSQSRKIIAIDTWENEGGSPDPDVPGYIRNKFDADCLAEVVDLLIVNRWRTELRQKLIEKPPFPEHSAWMQPLS